MALYLSTFFSMCLYILLLWLLVGNKTSAPTHVRQGHALMIFHFQTTHTPDSPAKSFLYSNTKSYIGPQVSVEAPAKFLVKHPSPSGDWGVLCGVSSVPFWNCGPFSRVAHHLGPGYASPSVDTTQLNNDAVIWWNMLLSAGRAGFRCDTGKWV